MDQQRKNELINQAKQAANNGRDAFDEFLRNLSPEEAEFIIDNALRNLGGFIVIQTPETNNPFYS